MSDVGVAVAAPPTRWRLAYRLLGLRVPEPYSTWVASDLRSDASVRRTALARVAGYLPFYLAWGAVLLHAERGAASLGGLSGALLAQVWSTRWQVERTRASFLRWQRVDAEGRPVEPRRTARLGNTAAALLLVGFLAALLLAFSRVLATID